MCGYVEKRREQALLLDLRVCAVCAGMLETFFAAGKKFFSRTFFEWEADDES
jgi:hypothetical protein